MADGHDEPSPRAGSGIDLSRRMDRIEQRQDSFDAKLDTLTTQLGAVAHNQETTEKLNEMRFANLANSVTNLDRTIHDFIDKIEGLITGETDNTMTRENRARLESYEKWRGSVDKRLNYLFGGVTFVAFVAGLTVPAVVAATVGWLHP